jgi:hypothetical protein
MGDGNLQDCRLHPLYPISHNTLSARDIHHPTGTCMQPLPLLAGPHATTNLHVGCESAMLCAGREIAACSSDGDLAALASLSPDTQLSAAYCSAGMFCIALPAMQECTAGVRVEAAGRPTCLMLDSTRHTPESSFDGTRLTAPYHYLGFRAHTQSRRQQTHQQNDQMSQEPASGR